MIKILFILICLCILANYIILHLKAIRTDKETDNDENYWMFTYDFKEKKKDSIFDREPEDIIREKNKKNKLIVILYLLSALIFIYAMFFFTKLIYLIFLVASHHIL